MTNKMNDKQRASLQNICERYGVEFIEAHYIVYPPESAMTAGYAEGWVGGNEHGLNDEYRDDARTTIYVGVSPEGQVHS